MNLLAAVRRILRRDELPPGFAGGLEPDEHVLGSAPLSEGGHVVVTSRGIWVPDAKEAMRRVGWHLVSKAKWQGGAIVLVEAREVENVGGIVLISDLPPVRLTLVEPGRVPQLVHERVTGSIHSRHHRDLPGGGAWFVQRKVSGVGRVVLQVRADPGTDEAVVRQLAGDVAKSLGLSS
jgi:hypothetical protein